MNGHIIGFRPQTQKLETPYKTPSSTLAVKELKLVFFFSFHLSYADISFFDFMNSWVAKDKINDYPTELEDFPLLRGLCKHVRDIPAVKQRLETRPDTAL